MNKRITLINVATTTTKTMTMMMMYTDQRDVVQDFLARLRNPTLVMLEWTPPRRPGIIKYRVRLSN